MGTFDICNWKFATRKIATPSNLNRGILRIWYIVTDGKLSDQLTTKCRNEENGYIPKSNWNQIPSVCENFCHSAAAFFFKMNHDMNQSFGIDPLQWIIPTIGVPVVTRFDGVFAEEASCLCIVVPIAQEHQSTVIVCLVLPLPRESKRRGIAARPADIVAKRIGEHRVSRALAAVGDGARAAQGVGMIETAGASPSLAHSGRIHGGTVF